MALAYMRNRRTTELRAVQLDGDEFRDLRAEIGPDNRPVWEQTSDANAHEQAKRVQEGAPRREDFGDDQQPREVIDGRAPDIEVRDRRIDPTPGEIEMGLSVEDKLEEVEGRKPKAQEVPVGLEDDAGNPLGLDDGSGYQTESGGGPTVQELKDELRNRDLPVSGNKQELQARLDEARANEEAPQ